MADHPTADDFIVGAAALAEPATPPANDLNDGLVHAICIGQEGNNPYATTFHDDLIKYGYASNAQGLTGQAAQLASIPIAEGASAGLPLAIWRGLPVGGVYLEMPIVDPVLWRHIYETDETVRRCVDLKVQLMVGQGCKLIPKGQNNANDYEPRDADWVPDPAQYKKAMKFLRASEPDMTITQLLTKLVLDRESQGNGYLEIARDENCEPLRFYHIPGETMRIALNGVGFCQVREWRHIHWARYGTGKNTVIARPQPRIVTMQADGAEASSWKPRVVNTYEIEFVSQAAADVMDAIPATAKELGDVLSDAAEQVAGVYADFAGQSAANLSGLSLKDAAQYENNNFYQQPPVAVASTVNDMMHFPLDSPADGHYGKPCTASCVEDHLGARNSKQFMSMYFDKGTVPTVVFLVQGRLAQEQSKIINTFFGGQQRMEAASGALVLEGLPDTTTQVVKLSSEALHEGAFIEYRNACNAGEARAFGVPLWMVGLGEKDANGDEEARLFIKSVISPAQKFITDKFNYFLEHDLGVTDWEFSLSVADLTDLKTLVDIQSKRLNDGSATTNEVRAANGDAPIEGGQIAYRNLGGGRVLTVGSLPSVEEWAKENPGGPVDVGGRPPTAPSTADGSDNAEGSEGAPGTSS
jgi:HK97 family phage portal protein